MGAYDLVVGVLLLGLFFNTYLYGICTYQFATYVHSKFRDSLWIRWVVSVLFSLDTVHSAVAVYVAWDTCVTNFANPTSLEYVRWTVPFTVIATSLTAVTTQIFLGHRVWLLTDNRVLFVLIGTLSMLAFVFGCIAGIMIGTVKEVTKLAPLVPYVTAWLALQTSTNLVITFFLTNALRHSRTGFRTTDTIINRLIAGALRTGLFASMLALANLFSFLLHRNTNLYAMFAYPMGRVYTNTLLNTLNCRATMKVNDMIVDSDNLRLSQPALSQVANSIYVRKEVVTDSLDIMNEEPESKEVVEDNFRV